MARFPVHVFAADPLTGNALASVSCNVKNRATGAAASLWDAEVAGSSVSNPLTTNSNGRAFAWTDAAALQIDYSGAGITAYSEYRAAPIDFVSALPSSPYDTQEIYYQSAAMATAGLIWHFRYRAGASGSYKWEGVGAQPPLAVEQVGGINNGTMESTTSTTFTTLATAGPAITVPLAGDYDCKGSAQGWQGNAGAAPGIRIWKTGDGSVGWQDSEAIYFPNAASATAQTMLSTQRRVTALAASNVVELRYVSSSVTTGVSFRNRNLWVAPVRVG